ncbi:hypothetical protein [Celeribacter baekdonensis]|uniref:hypothetical protein n=1 Tax=Celeribacter baekdonensis TaxID=875171 RepID=UPI00268F1A50
MIALTEFDRLEASALWRPEGDTQRVEVIVSVGEATLTLSDIKGRVLTHWSLPAVIRVSPPANALSPLPPHLTPMNRSKSTMN